MFLFYAKEIIDIIMNFSMLKLILFINNFKYECSFCKNMYH